MTNIILAYCVENQFVAAKIASTISSQVNVERVIFNNEHGIDVLDSKAENNKYPILLLISDNFLKSQKCMDNAMHILQRLGNAKRLIPVITDGVYSKDGNGHFVNVPTSFDRVSNVIQYMNYWQDKYLELRREKPRNSQDELIHSENVRKVRNISSEVGELLRYLRAMENYTYEQFEDSNFIILHRVLGLQVPNTAIENLKKPEISHTITPETTLPPKIEEKVPVLETTHKIEKELEIPIGVDISAIPGMNMLNLNSKEEVKTPDSIKVNIPPVIEEKLDKPLPGSFKTPNVNNDLNIEDLIADIKRDDLHRIDTSSQTPTNGFSNYQEIIDDVLNEDSKKADKIVETPASKAAELDEIKNIFNTDKNEDLSLSFENIFTPDAPVIANPKVEEDEPLPQPSYITPTIDIEPQPELIHEEVLKVNSAMSVAPVLNTNPLTPPPPVEDVENIKSEVSRILNDAEDTESHFEYEKPTTIEAPKEVVVPNNNAPKLNIPLHTEGVSAHSPKSKLELVKEQLSKDILNNELRYQYAAELVQNHRYQDTIEQLEILIENDRTHVEAYILMAYAAEQSGDYLLSLSCLEKVTLIKPDYPGIFYKLGCLIIEHFKNQKRKAAHYFKEAIEQDPKNADAYYQLGKLESEQNGDFTAIINYFNNAVLHNPYHADAAFELAKAKYEIGERAQAALFYRKAYESNPSLKSKINDEIFKYEEPVPEPVVNDNGITVLITGATSGIGRATAHIFAKNGYRIILTGRRGDRLNELKTQFEAEYKNINQVLEFDVRSLDAVKKAINAIGEQWKNVDILINNAGLASGLAPIHEGDIEDWEVMIDTNIKGLLYMTRAIAPQMVARQKGHIINVSSIAGKEIYPNGNVYIATKHAVDSLTRAMRIDLHKYNIRVSQVAPGAVEETEFSLVRFHGDAEKAKIYEEFQPLKASDVAESIYFIASRPEYVNIQDITLFGTQQAGANFIDKSGRKDVDRNA